MADNPFDDLIPASQNNASPFSDLMPENIEAARQEKIKNLSNSIGANRTPLDTILNVVSGVAQAGQKIGDLGVKAFGGKPGNDIDFPKLFGLGDTLQDKAERIAGQYGIPGGALSRISVPLGAAGDALEGLGGAGRFIANVASRGTPQAAFMGTQTENPLQGIAAGFGGQAVAETLPYAIPAAKAVWGGLKGATKGIANSGTDLVQSLKNVYKTAKETPQVLPDAPQLPSPPTLPELKLPETQQPPIMTDYQPKSGGAANDLMQTLGHGSENKEHASTALASIIRDSYGQRLDQTKPFFDYPMQIAGNERLYAHVDPLITTALDKEMDMMNRLEGLNVGGLYEKFKGSPTIQNAHNLQSELGSVVGDLEKNTDKSVGDRNTIASINSVRSKLKNDIVDAFQRHDATSNDNLTPMYKTGIELHKTNVEPYRSSPALRDITVKGVETPKNIESIFDTPTDITKKGASQVGPINKIMGDLPEQAKDLILFNKIGASKYADNPQKLVDALDAAKNEGYSTYFTPRINQHIENVKQQIANDAEQQAATKAAQAQAAKDQDRAYKSTVDTAKAEHKRKTQEIKDAYKAEKANAILEHKATVAQIKQRNQQINDAKKTRAYITLAGLASVPSVAGLYHLKNRITD